MALRLIRRAYGHHRAVSTFLTTTTVQRTTSNRVAAGPNRLISRCNFCTIPSSSGDDELVRAIESEIKCKSLNPHHDKEDDLPFAMHSLDKKTILLKREYCNEEIQLWMDKNDLNPESLFEVLVKMDKSSSESALYFRIYVYPDKEIVINKVLYGPKSYKDMHDQTILSCGEELQKAFLSYLSLRGINTELFNSLRNKMYVIGLNDIQSFLQSKPQPEPQSESEAQSQS